MSEPCNERLRGQYQAVVEVNRRLCRDHYLLRLRVAGGFPATKPGQFVQISCRAPAGEMPEAALLGQDRELVLGGPGQLQQVELLEPLALLRRPFSLAGRGDDERGSYVEIVHRVVGIGTAWLSRLQPGQGCELIGPLGNSFTLPPEKKLGLMVGGGVGLPPMFYLAQGLRAAGWEAVAFVGAMAQDLLAVEWQEGCRPDAGGQPTLCVRQFASQGMPAVVTTDDGSLGLKGRITAGLELYLASLSPEAARAAVLFTCGPERMMQAAAELAAHYGVDCQVCMEQAMACGMGTCQSCVVKIEDRQRPQASTPQGRPWRFRLACTDGPVFSAAAVVW